MALDHIVPVFDFETAIDIGQAVDHRGHTHKIVASSKQFLITEMGGQEYCFDRLGAEQTNFAVHKLTHPVKTERQIKKCIIYNTETMTPYEGFDRLKEANACLEQLVNQDKPFSRIGDTASPESKSTLIQLGLIKE